MRTMFMIDLLFVQVVLCKYFDKHSFKQVIHSEHMKEKLEIRCQTKDKLIYLIH